MSKAQLTKAQMEVLRRMAAGDDVMVFLWKRGLSTVLISNGVCRDDRITNTFGALLRRQFVEIIGDGCPIGALTSAGRALVEAARGK